MRVTGATLALRILTTNNEATNIAHFGVCSLSVVALCFSDVVEAASPGRAGDRGNAEKRL